MIQQQNSAEMKQWNSANGMVSKKEFVVSVSYFTLVNAERWPAHVRDEVS